MHSGISRRAVLALTVVAISVAALAGATTSTSAPTGQAAPAPSELRYILGTLKGLNVQQREQRLHDLARQEGGRLELYTSLSSLITRALVPAFEKDYPGIKVNLYRASSEPLIQRVFGEAKANATGCDILETNGTEMSILMYRKNVLIPYRQSPWAAGVPAKYRFDAFTAARLEAFVAAWNTNLVKTEEIPTTFEGFADPKWKGRLSMEPGDVDWYAGVTLYYQDQAEAKVPKPRAKTRAAKLRYQAAVKRARAAALKKADAMWLGMVQNSQITSGHTTQANLLAAGQFGVVVSAHAQSVEQLKSRRAPVTFGPPFVGPVMIRPQGVGICQRLKNKATALLFYDWLLSPKGQQVLKDNGSEPARVGFEDPELKGAPTVEMDLRPIIRNHGFWSKRYDALLRNAKG